MFPVSKCLLKTSMKTLDSGAFISNYEICPLSYYVSPFSVSHFFPMEKYMSKVSNKDRTISAAVVLVSSLVILSKQFAST